MVVSEQGGGRGALGGTRVGGMEWDRHHLSRPALKPPLEARPPAHSKPLTPSSRSPPHRPSTPKAAMALRATMSKPQVAGPAKASGLRTAVQRVATTAGVSVASLALALAAHADVRRAGWGEEGEG